MAKSNGYDDVVKLINDIVSTGRVENSSGKPSSSGQASSSGQTASPAKKQSSEDYFASRRKALGLDKVKVDNDYIRSFLDDSQKHMKSADSDNKRMGVGTSKSIYESRKFSSDDLSKRSYEIRRYLDDNKDALDSETYASLKDYLDAFDSISSQSRYAFYKNNQLYSQFDTQEDYDKWRDYSTPEGRKERYAKNQTRIDELKEERKKLAGGGNHLLRLALHNAGAISTDDYLIQSQKAKEIDKEIASIESEMRMYERGNTDETGFYYGSKAIDDYGELANRGDFEKVSANRNFHNPGRDALSKYDAMSDSSTWYTDANNNIFDAFGNKIDPSITDEKGNILHPYATNSEYAVTDRLALYLNTSEEEKQEALGSAAGTEGTWESIIKDGYDGNWELLSKDEIDVYYYLLNNSGQETADKYLSDMKTELNRRNMTQTNIRYTTAFSEADALERLALSIASTPAQLFGGATAFIEDTAMNMMGKDINPYSAAHAGTNFSSTVRSNQAQAFDEATGGVAIPFINFTAGDLYQAGMSALDMAVGGKLGSGAYEALMGMGSASSEAKKLYEQGASRGQIMWGGALAGAAEIVFEHASIESLINLKDADTALQFVKNLLIQGGIEASEEGFTEIANTITNAIVMGSESDWAKLVEENNGDKLAAFIAKVQEVGNAAFSGFVSGSMGGTAHSVASYAQVQAQNQDLGSYISGAKNTDALIALAQEMAKNASKSDQKSLTAQSNRLSKDFLTEGGKHRATGRLYNTVRSVVTEQNISEISSALQEKGISKKDATAIAGAVAAQANGLKLSDKQQKVLDKFSKNADVKNVVNEILENKESGINQRAKSVAKFEFDTMRNDIIARMEQVVPGQKNKTDDGSLPTEENVASYEVSEDGKAYLLSDPSTEVSVRSIASIKDGKVMLALEDGSTVDAEDVSFGSEGEALVYATVAQMETSVKAANILVNGLKSQSDDLSAKAYAHGINEAFRYGKLGIPASELKHSSFASKLNPGQQEYVYRQGKKAAGKQVAKNQATVNQAYNEAVTAASSAVKTGGYHAVLDEGITVLSLNESQKASYKLADQIAEAANVTIHVYLGKTGERGYYKPSTDEIWLNLNATNKSRKSMMAFALGHELVHRAKKGSPGKYQAFAEFLMKEYGKTGASVEAMIAEELQAAKDYGIKMTEEQAFEEVVCDACQRMLLDTDAGKRLAEFGAQNRENKSFLEDLKRWITEFMDRLRSIFKDVEPDSLAAKEFAKFDENAKQILADMYVDMTIDAGNKLSTIQSAFGKGTVVEANKQGEFTTARSADGSQVLNNLSTWKNGGRETLEATLLREGYTEDEVKAALTIMDEKQRLVESIANEVNDNGKMAFPEQGRINEATLTTDLKDGHAVLSALVSNGDYPVNIDLLMVCKKRKAYQRVINRLCETGMIKQATVDALAIAEINKILGKYGFETACLGCFVESRRLRIQEWAQTIVKEWNAEVKKRNPNAKAFGFGKGEANLTPDEVMQLIGELESGGEKNDQGNLNLGQGSAVKRMGVLLDKVPSLRRTLSIEDLITPDGLTSLRRFDSNLFSMVKSRYGSNSPKFVQEFNPYNHELAKYGKVPTEYNSLREYLYAIGGARMQSFSDFIIENWFDYCQIVADLAARKLPMHTYTKEIALARLFGLTGIKINMSLIPDVDRSLPREYAGLTRNSKGELELIWADKDRFKATGGKSYMQSINFADAMELQNDPRYSANVGTIAVGISDLHIRTMLNDPRIRMVIPYHSSGMNPIFADLMGTSYYKDYTLFQNTTIKQVYNSKGQPVSLDLSKTQEGKLTGGFLFNSVLQELGDARATAEAYKEWCADASKHTITIKGETYTAELTPKFNDFSGEENYYKLLEDFNTYDCITEEAAPQGDVQQVYPEGFEEILRVELSAQEGHRQKQEANKSFDKAMEEIEGYLKNHTKADTVHYANQHGIKLGAKDKKLSAEDKARLKELQKEGVSFMLPKVDAEGNQLSEEQQEFFKDSKVRDENGKLIPMYHGTNNPDFTVFDPKKSDDNISLFFTSDPDVANTYTTLQDKGRDVDPYNLITKNSSAKQFNAAQERVGGGLRVVKITPEWIQEMKGKAEKSATRLFGIANKYADLLEYNNSTGMFTPSIETIRDITNNGVENLKAHDIPVLRKAMGDAQQRSFFARDHKGAEKEIRRIWSDNYKLYDEVWNYKIAASTPDSAIGQYTYTEIIGDGTFLTDRNLDFHGHIIPGTEKEMVAKAIDRMQWVEDHNLGNRYKVYLNLVNPYIIDATVDYSGKMDDVTLEHNLGKWSVSFGNEEIYFNKRMTAAEFDAFVDSAFDAKTAAKIKAQIKEDDEIHRREWAEFDFDPSEVWHHIELQDVNIKHHEPGNWNALRFNGKEDAKTREVSAWAKENGFDGVIFKNMKDAGGYAFQKGRGGSTVAVAFSSEQVKSVDNKNPTSDPDLRYSLPMARNFSYQELTAKPDFQGKVINSTQQVKMTAGGLVDEEWLVNLIKSKCSTVNTKSPEPTYYVNVPDIGRNVEITRKGIHHGLIRNKLTPSGKVPDAVLVNARAMINLPEILANSIEVNRSQRGANIDVPFTSVMIGVTGIENAAGIDEYYAVRIMVEERANQNPILVGANVLGKLYAVNAKKISNPHAQVTTKGVALTTDRLFSYSVADVLNDVKTVFDNTFSVDVYQKLNTSRKVDDFSSHLLYNLPVGEDTSPRALLSNALEAVTTNPIEKQKLQEYKEKVAMINAEEQKLNELRKQIKKLSFGNGHYDAKKIRELQFEANMTANRINTYDRQLLRLEASKPLQNVLTREKKMAYDRGVQKGKEALDAYRERTEKKQQEIIERYQESRKRGVENRQKTFMRQKIRKVIRDLDKLLNRGNKKVNVKEDMKDFVANALASAEILFIDSYTNEDMVRNGVTTDMTPEEAKFMNEARAIMDEIASLPTGYEGWMERQEKENNLKGRLAYRMAKLRDVFVRERARINETQVSEVLGNLADSYARLQNSEYAHVQGAYHEAVHEYLKMLQEDVGGTIIKDMTLGQLEELYKAYTMVKTTVYNANRMFADNLNNTRENLANKVMFEVHEAGGEHGLWSKFGDKLNSFSWNNEKPVYAFERIGSKTLKTLYGNIRKGQDGWAINLQEANDFRKAMYEKHKHSTWDVLKRYKFTSSSGIDFELDLDQIMSLYAYSKRAQAHDHLLKGGFVFDGNTEVLVNKHGLKIPYLNKDATAYNVSFEILEEIISKLTPEQKAFADDMQEYLSSTMGEKGNEVSMELYGVKLFNEKFYFPLRSAGQYMERAKEADMKKEQGQINIANSGFSKATKIKASNPVVLAGFMDVWASHVNEMSMYHSFVLPMEDFRRVYNYSSPHMEGQQSASVNGVIQNAYGAAATDYIDKLYRDLNGGAITDNTTGIINKLMGLFKKGAVFASASVTLQQPSAVARATALVDVKHFFGPKVDAKRHKALWAEVKKYAPVAIIKEMGFFDTNMGRSAVDFLTAEEYSGIKEKAEALVKDESYRDELLSKAPALADELSWCVIWEAVKRETKERHPDMDVKSDEFLKLAGERFSEVIDKTQVYDSVLARSANMRSKDTGMKMATAFMAEPTTSINMVADALRKGKKGDKKFARRAIGSVVASVILNSILVSFVYAARDDDEDQSFAEKYIEAVVGGIVDGLNPATYIPFVKDVVSIIQGYDVERSDMAVISDLWNAWQKLGRDDVSAWNKVEGFVGSICQIFGLPLKNIMRDVRSAYQAFDTIVNGENTSAMGLVYAVASGAFGGDDMSNAEKLYTAKKNEQAIFGTDSYTNRVASRYENEKAANSAIISVIKEKYLSGELDEWNANRELVLYAKVDAGAAIDIMDKWNYQKENGTDDGYSKYLKFYEAVQTGKDLKSIIKTYTDNGVDQSTLSQQLSEHFRPEYVKMSAAERANIKGYLINAKVALGYYREETEEMLTEWDFEAKHGMSYEDMLDGYKEGNMSRERVKELMIEYGKSDSDAETKLNELDMARKYGIEYSDREMAYKEGKISEEDLRSMYLEKGKTEEETDNLIEAHNWLKANPEYDLYASTVVQYIKPLEGLDRSIEDTGMDIDTFLREKKEVGKFESDKDEKGNAIAYSKINKAYPYINSLDLTPEQKTALAVACGWSLKTVKKNKLW